MRAGLLVSLVLIASAQEPRESNALGDVLVAAFRNQIGEVFATKSARFATDPVICVGITERGRPRDPAAPSIQKGARAERPEVGGRRGRQGIAEGGDEIQEGSSAVLPGPSDLLVLFHTDPIGGARGDLSSAGRDP